MHRYTARVAWSGSTSIGYDSYDRRHAGTGPAGFTVALSADAAFRGDPACLNPEQLLVLAAASCQLLSFLAVAARARLHVIDYRDQGTGEMSEESFTRISLRPQITVASPAEHPVRSERVHHLCQIAHDECYISNSLRTEVIVFPVVTICPVAPVP